MPQIEKASPKDFELIFPLLDQFNDRTSREEWKQLFEDPFHSGEGYNGYKMLEDGRLIGYAGYIFSHRVIDGRDEKICNLSSWIIDPAYQGKGRLSYLFLKRVVEEAAALVEEGYSIASFSSIPSIVRLLKKNGFQLLDTHRQVLPFYPWMLLGGRKGKVLFGQEEVEARLPEAELRLSRDHRRFACKQFLITSPDGDCLVIAKRKRLYRIPFLRIDHLSNPAVFQEGIGPSLARICMHFGVGGIFLDERFLEGNKLPASLRMKLVQEQVCLSKRLPPHAMDPLYSELYLLDF